jgi:GH15 family glucan-1,4-alpha-glucosidase
MPSKIEDYAIIGDCQSAALVGKDGSIDWLCWPRFDSGSCFGALLGSVENGRWKIAPVAEQVLIERQYRESTLILETRFETEEGVATVIDFMPVREENSSVIRIVRGERGKVAMKMEMSLRFDYGYSIPWVTRLDDEPGATQVLRGIAGPNMIVLRTTAPLRGENMHTVADFTVSEGESVAFVMSYGLSHLPLPAAVDAGHALKETESFWKDWTGRCTYRGTWKNEVERSLITLKALTYWPTGGILAAPTTSLPEKIGGARNWDYRLCWLRDASFSLWVLMQAGYYDEASDWLNWLLRAVAGSPDQLQTMYGVAGERDLQEREVPWLPGYQKSRPVRIGNAASEQLQLDVYGEMSAVMHHSLRGNLPRNERGIELFWVLLEHLEKIWHEPDEGIWEVRSGRKQFVHSKVMAWVAFDRAIKSCEQFHIEGPVERWRTVREQIHAEVCEKGFNPSMGSFVQSYGSKNVDANLLMIPKSGFLPASDSRVRGTVEAIERNLIRDGFVMRYDTEEADDGLPPGEGVFLPCSFWLADVYFLQGREDEARKLFERLLNLQNDLGLYSEEYDPASRRQVGNFPQAFTHVAMIHTALAIDHVAHAAPPGPELQQAAAEKPRSQS